MLNGALLSASSTSCAELSKIKAIEEGGRSSGCEWQRRKINSASDPRTARVLEEEARKAIRELKLSGRLPKTPNFAVDLYFEERRDGARLTTRGESRAQAEINRAARLHIAGRRVGRRSASGATRSP